jgi:hypothetical protein
MLLPLRLSVATSVAALSPAPKSRVRTPALQQAVTEIYNSKIEGTSPLITEELEKIVA